MATNPVTTPTIRCPRCEHPINDHRAEACTAEAFGACDCHLDPNTIAVALLFGELTQAPAPLRSVSRQADGSWS